MVETSVSDYLVFLKDLGESGVDYFLEGGQAVNFWAEYYSAKGAQVILAPHQPFTSKDCDIWISFAALQYLRAKNDGSRFVAGSSPADGQVGIVTLQGEPKRRIDLMSNVYGIAQSRLKSLKDRSLEIDGIQVIDPILLFQSKCHCLLGLNQGGRQDRKHVEMLSLLVPEHIEDLLEEVLAGRLSQRALINEVKVLQKILKTNAVKRALDEIGRPSSALIPIAKFKGSGLTKIESFAEMMTR